MTTEEVRRRWLIAALLVVAAGLGVLIRSDARQDAVAVAGQNYLTNVGERRAITLADGSTVELAPQSSLSVTYGASERVVALSGRAFFTVTRNENKPFRVRTRDYDVVVLGTSFDVSSYASEPTLVAVATGRVRVDQTVVTPGQLATAEQGTITVTPVDVNAITAWRTGKGVIYQPK